MLKPAFTSTVQPVHGQGKHSYTAHLLGTAGLLATTRDVLHGALLLILLDPKRCWARIVAMMGTLSVQTENRSA